MISVDDVGYSVNGRNLVEAVGFEFEAGTLLAVAGPNGAGKSTLLKLLTRELVPTSGGVTLAGRSLTDYTYLELAKKRAVLTQQNTLSLPFNVDEVVMMGRYPYHKNAPEDRDYRIVEECLRRVDMLAFASRKFTTLSGGEQQRVQLAKSLAQIWEVDDAFLFLDEPTNGLDLRHQYLALEIARELTLKGCGVVAVLHDLNMAMHYADQVLMMQRGRLVALGEPADVLTRANVMGVFGVDVELVTLSGSSDTVIVPKPTGLAGLFK